jgi:hypothetical protein
MFAFQSKFIPEYSIFVIIVFSLIIHLKNLYLSVFIFSHKGSSYLYPFCGASINVQKY